MNHPDDAQPWWIYFAIAFALAVAAYGAIGAPGLIEGDDLLNSCQQRTQQADAKHQVGR